MQPGITIAERHLPEADGKAFDGALAFKTATQTEAAGQMLGMDEAEGIVTAIVSVTGVEDEVADIIEPGAYAETLTKRNPKVCWAHSWEHPIGRVLAIEELHPGDQRLPTRTRDGKAWPKEAGALVASMQFNMRSTEGKQAFEAVRFYSETGECEYSIGYQVPMGKATRNPTTGVRHIKALDLYELSVVLFGAHTMTGTLSIKAAFEAAMERKSIIPPGGRGAAMPSGMTGTVSPATPGPAARALAAAREAKALTADTADGGSSATPDFSDGVMVAVYPDSTAADNVYAQIAGPDDNVARDELHVTLAYLGNVNEVSLSADDIRTAVTGAVEGMPVLEGEIAGIGQFPDSGDGAPTWAPVDVPGLGLLREQIVAALGDAVRTDHGFTPHMTLGYDLGLIDPIDETPVTFSSVRVVYGDQTYDVALGLGGLPPEDKGMDAATRKRKPTMPGEGDRYPIGNVEDLRNAVQAYGRAAAGDKAKVKRWIIRRARELGAVSALPDSWDVKGLPMDTMEDFLVSFSDADWASLADTELGDGIAEEVKAYLDAMEVKATTPGGRAGDDSPVGKPGGRQNWVDKVGGLPKYIRMVAHALIRKGHSEGSAISIAVATIKRWAANAGGKVSEKVQAAAAAALAQWERMKAQSHAKKAAAYDPSYDVVRVDHYDPTLDGKSRMGVDGSYPYLPGTYEQRMNAVRQAVNEALRGAHDPEKDRYEWDHVDVRATWDDRVIASRVKWSGGDDECETYEMTYDVTGDGTIELGEPEEVHLQVVALTDDGDTIEPDGEPDDSGEPLADHLPLADYVQNVTFAIKATRPPRIEGKAGRVLSGRNERRLRNAVRGLLDVLAAAGVEIDPNTADPSDITHDLNVDAGDRRIDMDPNIDTSTTSPSASTVRQGRKVLTMEEINADMAELGLPTL